MQTCRASGLEKDQLKKKSKCIHQESAGQQASPLKIISPFYERICQNNTCKCEFHKRQRKPPKMIQRVRTQAVEDQLNPWKVESHTQSSNLKKIPPLRLKIEKPSRFRVTMADYLKTFPKELKWQRLIQLDCHNEEFEEFLRQHPQIILENGKSKKQKQNGHMTRRNHTEKQEILENGKQKTIACKEMKSQEASNPIPKRVLFTGDFLSERQTSQKSNEGNFVMPTLTEAIGTQKIRIFSCRRASLKEMEDIRGRVVKKICDKLSTKDYHENEEGQKIIKFIAECNIDIYKEILQEMEQELQGHLNLNGAFESNTKVLVSITLQNIRLKIIDLKQIDPNYEKKLELISTLCQQFGFSEGEYKISIAEFFQENKTRKSWCSNIRIGRSEKSDKLSFGLHMGLPSATSEFSNPSLESKSKNKILSTTRKEIQKDIEAKKIQKTQQNLHSQKQHPLKIKKKIKTLKKQEGGDESSQDQSNEISQDQKIDNIEDLPLDFLPKKKVFARRIGSLLTQQESQKVQISHLAEISNYLQKNKEYLQQVQKHLTQIHCEHLAIKIEDGVLTKKRKIRAINQALQMNVKNGNNYAELFKYMEIYTDYCDLVVKKKKAVEMPRSKQVHQVNFMEQFATAPLKDLFLDLQKERELKFIRLRLIEKTHQNDDIGIALPVTRDRPKLLGRKSGAVILSNRLQLQNSSRNVDWMCQKNLAETVRVQIVNKRLLDIPKMIPICPKIPPLVLEDSFSARFQKLKRKLIRGKA